MAAANSSRRRRLPSSDHIEEDDPSEHEGEDDEEQPRQRVTRDRKPNVKKVKGRSRPQAVNDEEDGQHDDVDEDRIDVNDFKDQPLIKGHAPKISGIASDWSNFRKMTHGPSFSLITDIAQHMAEVDENGKGTVELEKLMREFIDIEDEMLAHEEVVASIHQLVAQGEPVSDAVDRYEKGVKSRINDYRHKTTRQRYAKKQEYVNFQQTIYEARGEAMPPVTELLPREDGDVSDDDDDLEIGGVTQDYKCPLTMTILVDPLTSSVCRHSFSSDAIRQYLGPNKAIVKKCPASGCNKSFCQNDLKMNKDLERRVRAAGRRMRAQEEDDEGAGDDEVIE